MKTFEQLREINKRRDLLFTGMVAKALPPDMVNEGREFLNSFVKPLVHRVVKRQLIKLK